MTSKFVGYFLEEVSGWQKKLSTADSVIAIWFEVQRTWSHLESIFIGSEDIRAQLPQHSKEFDSIDADFKVLFIYSTYMYDVYRAKVFSSSSSIMHQMVVAISFSLRQKFFHMKNRKEPHPASNIKILRLQSFFIVLTFLGPQNNITAGPGYNVIIALPLMATFHILEE